MADDWTMIKSCILVNIRGEQPKLTALVIFDHVNKQNDRAPSISERSTPFSACGSYIACCRQGGQK